jgi:hypothetical protein
MNLITLSQARSTLWSFGSPVAYASATSPQKLEWDGKLNRVLERLVGRCKPRHTLRRVNIPIYNGMVTLPRYFGAVYGMRVIEGCCSYPLLIYTRFYEAFASGSGCDSCDGGAIPATDIAQTFKVPSAGFRLRTKVPGSSGPEGAMALIGGRDESWNELFDSVSLTMTNSTETTTRIWNALPQIQKVATTHAVELYAVDSANAETLIAIYAPGETVPAYPRYLVPSAGCATMVQALCKLAFVPVVADTDVVYPSNYGALEKGMAALDRDSKADYQLGDALWNQALEILDEDRREFDGDGQVPTLRWMNGYGAGDIVNVM